MNRHIQRSSANSQSTPNNTIMPFKKNNNLKQAFLFKNIMLTDKKSNEYLVVL